MGLFDDIPISDGSGDGFNPQTGRLQLTVRPMRPPGEDASEYRAVSAPTETGDRAFGRYGVMGDDIGPWTKEVLGRELSRREFLLWPEAQDAVFEEKFGHDVEHNGSAAARAWLTSGASGSAIGDATSTTFAQQAMQDNDSTAPIASASTMQSQSAAMPATDALADIPNDPFERAALSRRRGVLPSRGRKEGIATAFPEEMAIDTWTLPRRFSEAVAKYARTRELDVWPILEGALMAAGFGAPLARMLMGRAARVARARQSVDAARDGMSNMRGPLEAPERLFREDYPWGAFGDKTGRLLRDIEGRPMTAKYVAGRRVRGGADEAIPEADLPRLAKLLGAPMKRVPEHKMPDAVGKYDPIKREILVRKDLSARELPLVKGHELGHLIDFKAGRVPLEGIGAELQTLYHLLNLSPRKTRHLIGPQDLGYFHFAVRDELMAEAIRAYLSNPNFIKSVAPQTAAAIRRAWNSLPKKSKILQFNTLAAGAAGALGAAGPGSGGGSPAGEDGI